MSFGWIGRDEVASLLNISPGRVSQLLGEDPRFPEPSFSIGKTRIWRKDAVVAYQRGRKGRSTLSIQSLQPPAAPLPRVLDQVVTLRPEPLLSYVREVYIRAWQGPVTVALIEGLDDPAGAGLTSKIEGFTSQLTRLFPQILTGEICWIQSNRDTSSGTPKTELVNVVFEINPDSTLENPHWVYFEGFEPLTEILGDRNVELYPAGTLTKTNIRQFQRNGGPIEVIANENQIAHRMEAIRAIENSPLPSTDKATALDYLATALQLVDNNAGSTLPYMKWQYEEHRRTDPTAFIPRWAVERTDRPLTDEERSKVESLSLPGNGSGQPFDDERLLTLMRSLQRWSEDIDEYADQPDSELYKHVRDLTSALPVFISDEQLKAEADHLRGEIGGPFIARFHKSLPHIRQYLDGAGELMLRNRAEQQREQRMLAREVSYSQHDHSAYFGFDRFGNHIAQSVDDFARGDEGNIAVLWPREPVPVSIADHILIEGNSDTLAFIANPDRSLRALLPRIETPSSVGWSTGYGGSGPVDLIDAVCNVLTSSGLRPNTQSIRSAITPATTPETVWLKVNDIIER